MLSGVGPAHQLRDAGVPVRLDLAGVGQNLRDHPHVAVAWQPRAGYPMDPALPRYQVVIRYTAGGSTLRNDMQFLMFSFATARLDSGGDGQTPVGLAMGPILNLALGQGELQLRAADPDVQPVLDYNFLGDPFDRRRLREAVHLCVQLGAHRGFREILGRRIVPADEDLASDAALDRWLMREVRTTHHVSGTCKMGRSSDPLAVVDQYGRVHGLEALRVVDASIMPDCVRANINATTMMIGERIADVLLHGESDVPFPVDMARSLSTTTSG
jgi:choline dehydrogenase